MLPHVTWMRFLFVVMSLGMLVGENTLPQAVGIDVFDRHTSQVLRDATAGQQAVRSLSSRQAAELDRLSAGITSSAVVVVTDQGNVAKLLISWAFRKVVSPAPAQAMTQKEGQAPQGKQRPLVIPLLVLERYATYDKDRQDQTTANGKQVLLFPGFGFDLDIGQVVPAGQGEDIRFTEKRKLEALGTARLFPLDGTALPAVEAQKPYDPNDHQGVRVRDFSGRWQVDADGRWQGSLELEVNDEGRVRGTYTSQDTDSVYQVKGSLASGVPNRILLQIALPAAVQEVDAYLWTTDKSAMAGTTQMVGRTFGFYAQRLSKTPGAEAPAAEKSAQGTQERTGG